MSSKHLASISSSLEHLIQYGDPCSCSRSITVADTTMSALKILRDILERGGTSRWLSSQREVEDVAKLVNTLSGICKLEVREQVEEQLLTFSMEESMNNLVNPGSGLMEVGSFCSCCYCCSCCCSCLFCSCC